MTTQPESPFWRRLRLDEMSDAQWESLCDGCARCCLIKLEDEDSGEVFTTGVACHLLELGTCRCRDYEARFERVPGCLRMTPALARDLDWLPSTCAYRRVAHGQDLPWWHPLRSGDPDGALDADASIRPFAISEDDVHPDDLARFILDDA